MSANRRQRSTAHGLPLNVPEPAPAIFTGLVGELVDLFEPCTEAAPFAIASQFIVMFGNAIGHGPVFYVGETPHYMNEFLAIVGTSSRARKGDSKHIASRPLEMADEQWAKTCIASGLSSGEGLISQVQDPPENGNDDDDDDEERDKRLLVIETEFSATLKQFHRNENILSNTLRDAWDSKSPLRTLTKNSPLKASDAHISIIAHTTPEDLKRYLTNTEVANGMGNRFMFALVHRTKHLPSPPRAPQDKLRAFVKKVAATLHYAAGVGEMTRSPKAEQFWHEIYPQLTEEEPGLVGQMLARSEAHVLRLSALYALLAQRSVIRRCDIEAALAFWKYCADSTRAIFAKMTGNKHADDILAALPPGTERTPTDIRDQVFSNHVSREELNIALALLEELGEVTLRTEDTGGRPRTVVTRIENGGKR